MEPSLNDTTVPQVLTLTANPALDVLTSVERVLPTHKLRCNHSIEHPGGGGVNVARVLHRFGTPVKSLYPVGGVTGRWHESLMKEEGINTQVVEIGGETRESFSVRESSTSQDYRFILPGPLLTPREIELLSNAVNTQWPSQYLVLSGGLAPGMSDDFYADLIGVAHQRGVKVILDTNGSALVASLAAGVYLFKPSLSELNSLSPTTLKGRSDYVHFCQSLIEQKKAEVIALTLGEEGAVLVTQSQSWYAPPIQVEVKTTIGAGDSFVGAMTWSMLQGHDVLRSFAYAMAGGASALLNTGTSLCQPLEVYDLVDKVEIISFSTKE